nr:hypothetical protein [Bacilli bacterium]
MNEDVIRNLQGLLENLSRDSESTSLKNEIEELENRLSNIDYYKTPNKADGTPAQTGDFGREYRNYSSHINSVNESLNNLVNNKIAEITARQSDLDQTVEQAQLTNDTATIDEASRAAAENRAVLNNLTELANRQTSLAEGLEQAQLTNDNALIEEANRALEENQRLLDETMLSFEDSADKDEYQRLVDDRAEEIREHEEFLARAKALQAKDENGNVYLDKNGNPVVNVNLYNMISDEKKLAKAKEEYAKTNLGMLENIMNSMGANTNDYQTDTSVETSTEEQETSVEDAPTTSNNDQELIAKYNQMMLNGEYFMDNTGTIVLGTSLIKDGDSGIYTWNNDMGLANYQTLLANLTPYGKTASIDELENLCSEETLDPEIKASLQAIIYDKKHDYYFEHPEYGKVIPVSDKVKEDGTVDVQTHGGEIVSVKLSELISSDVLVDKEENKEINDAIVDIPQVDPKIAEERRANLDRIFNDYTMNGSALDNLEKNGIYRATTPVEETDDKIIEMPTKENEETVIAAVAANDVDTDIPSTAEEIKDDKESEEKDMAKGKRENNVNYTEATPEQKKKAKEKLGKLKAIGYALVGIIAAAGTYFGVSKLLDGTEQEKTSIETDYENKLEDEVEDVIEDAEKTIGDLDHHNKSDGDFTKPEHTVTNTNPAPAPAPVEPIIGLPAESVDPNLLNLYPAFGNVTNPYTGQPVAPVSVEEHQTSTDPTPEQIAAAQADIANGVNVGDVLAGTGQTVLSQTTTISGGEYTGTTETVVQDNPVTPNNVAVTDVVNTPSTETVQQPANDVVNTDTNVTTIDINPGDTSYSWTDSTGETHVEEIPAGATEVQVEERTEEVLPAELSGLSQDELAAIASYQDEANSLEEGGRSL